MLAVDIFYAYYKSIATPMAYLPCMYTIAEKIKFIICIQCSHFKNLHKILGGVKRWLEG